MPEPQEQPQEEFGYKRAYYESPIKRAREIYGNEPFKELLEERRDKPQEKEDVGKKIKKRRTERKKVIEEFRRLEDIGYRDELTGIYNRAGFEKRLQEEVARLKRMGGEAVIINFDLNKLKEVNDKGGHKAGDEYIKSAAKTMQEVTRPNDPVARTGGDEFTIILQGSDEEGALKYWERLKSMLDSRGISLAAGVAPLDPREVEESKNLADISMYKAKVLGNGESRIETAYNLTAEEIEGGPEEVKKKFSLR